MKDMKALRKFLEFSPFKMGAIGTIVFAVLVTKYYEIPAYRVRESTRWVQGLHRLHEWTIDLRFRDRGAQPPPGGQVALITVDDEAVEKLGRWPWPRTTIARMIQELLKNKAKLIGFDSVFSEIDQNQTLISLGKIRDMTETPDALKPILEEEIRIADHDTILANTVKENADKLVMGSYFDEEQPLHNADGTTSPAFLPYQDNCLDIALENRPDYQVIAKDEPELLVQDDSTTELDEGLVQVLKQLLGQVEEVTRKAAEEKKYSEIETQTEIRRSLVHFCQNWLTENDETVATVEQLWPEVQQQLPTLAGKSYTDIRNHLRSSGEYKRNPVALMERLIPNIPLVAGFTKHTGYFNAFLSLDGTIRRSNLIARYGTKLMPSLGLRMAQMDSGNNLAIKFEEDPIYTDSKRIKSLEFLDSKSGQLVEQIPVDAAGGLQINYAGPRYSFPHVSVAELLNGKDTMKVLQRRGDRGEAFEVNKAEFIKDKLFIFGATAIGIFDLRVSPFDENFPGLETHANVLSNILNKNYMRVHPKEASVMPAIVLVLGLVLAFLLSRTGAIAGLLLTFGSLASVYAVDRFLFFQNGIVTTIVFPIIVIAFINYILVTAYKYFTEERKKRELKGTFQKYVSPQIVDQILKDPENLQLGGRKQRMSVIFSDVRGFTTISEKLDPTKLSDVLNLYLSPMTKLVFAHKGTLDKYMGDAIMAFFGAPIQYENHAECACRCALDMMKDLERLHKVFEDQGLPRIDIGIGINTGEMCVGNMGSDTVRSYTVMGDAVNLGSRLEGINKSYGTHIIISEFTQADVKSKFFTREVDWVKVKGKNLPVKIFELMGEGKPSDDQVRFIEQFDTGTKLYHERKFSEAIPHFQAAMGIVPGDPTSDLYIERCEAFVTEPPPEDWDGVYTMKEK